MLRCLRAIFIVLFISSLDSARAEWINYDELTKLKIKYELSAFPNYSKTFEQDKNLYSGIIQKISYKKDIDEQLDGLWTLSYMCGTDSLTSTTIDINCQRMTGPEISVIFYGENSWNETMQRTGEEGVYKKVNFFKTFDVEIGSYSKQGKLFIHSPLTLLSFQIQGTIKAMYGLLESQVEGKCEKIKDPESIVCIGHSKLKPNKSYINIFERPDYY